MPVLQLSADHAFPVTAPATITNTGGGTVFYSSRPDVSAGSNDGSLTVGQSVTSSFAEAWVRADSYTSITVTYTSPVSGSVDSGSVQIAGAGGDGVVNDTAALQAALNAAPTGSTIVGVKGAIYATTGITFPRDGLKLDLRGAALVPHSSFADGGTLVTMTGRSDCSIENGRQLAPSTAVAVTFLARSTCTRCHVRNMNCKNNTGFAGKNSIFVTDLALTGCIEDGNYVDGTGAGPAGFGMAISSGYTRCSITRNTFIGCQYSINPASYTVTPNSDLRIEGNNILNDQAIAIQDYTVNDVSNSQRTLVSRNLIVNPLLQGVSCTGLGALVSENTIINGRGWAIEANGTASRVTGNHIEYTTASTADTGIILNTNIVPVTLSTTATATVNQTPTTVTVASTAGVLSSSGQILAGGVALNYTGLTATALTGVTTATGTVAITNGQTLYYEPALNGSICSNNMIINAYVGVAEYSCTIPNTISGNQIVNAMHIGITLTAPSTVTGNALHFTVPAPAAGRFGIQTATGATVANNKLRYGPRSYVSGTNGDLPLYLVGANVKCVSNTIDHGGRADTHIFCDGIGAQGGGWTLRDNDFINGGAGCGYHFNFSTATGYTAKDNRGIIQLGTAPAVSAGANQGTSPPASIVVGTDDSVAIAFGTGTGATAGAQVVVAFSQARARAPLSVLAVARTAATITAGLYVSSVTASGFTLNFANVPASSQSNVTFIVDVVITWP